jgi:hypothetical protein
MFAGIRNSGAAVGPPGIVDEAFSFSEVSNIVSPGAFGGSSNGAGTL